MCRLERGIGFAQRRTGVADEALVLGNQQHVLRAVRAVGPLVEPQRQRDRKAAALSDLAFDLDFAAHQVNDIFRNRHAEAGALHLVRHGIFRAGERLEDVPHKLGRHAVAGIGHGKGELRVAVNAARQLAQLKLNITALGRILDRVRKQVEENLPQVHAVADEVFVHNVLAADDKILFVFVRLCADDAVHLTHLLGEAYLLRFQLDLARLDAAHIQNIVDKAEQMAAR